MGDAVRALLPGNVEREARTNTCEHCLIARQDGSIVTAILVNLSEQGFCVESATSFDDEEQIEVRVLGACLKGFVRWTKGPRAGGILLQIRT
jgi:hypothetical protein